MGFSCPYLALVMTDDHCLVGVTGIHYMGKMAGIQCLRNDIYPLFGGGSRGMLSGGGGRDL